ncbi:MAG: glycogen debranching protein GlgX [Pantoea sp.]|uniref:Glycogen debranching enzyme n=1 Tax=Pantoea brenneri TaxID=472694 RepID=A0AAX3J1W8_9GAMM|nr:MULTISPECIES: glycogen debranching protein GlgX [Pantoea]MBS6035502.1 glycogen debranching protein GlgX [Pantoea sp.]MDH2125705.1 glycogen debranching protein GlgX [Pantoea brenneri]VXB19233.1 glycogen debranching enzyme [Pantoea brenneri]
MTITAGDPQPPGASYDGKGVNFTLFSQHASRVELCLFDENGVEQRIDLPGRSGDIWHGYVPTLKPGQRYGYRVHGPWAPRQGHRFNPAKLLVDPCARAVEGDVPDDARFHGGINAPDPHDSAAIAPKSRVVAEDFDWQDDVAPRTPWGNTVIYEAHVRGLTRQHPEIPETLRGTYAALGHPVMVDYLRRLGITAIELLPVAHFASEPRLLQLGLSNYWGYNPFALWAVDPRYASGQDGLTPLQEFQQAVKNLHAAGIEVLLDVVFNHTAELDAIGPTISMRGIDNASYYWLDEQGDYQNWTGCGNTLNLHHPQVMAWALDTLRYWVRVCHVDGFRFDLAPVLGRTPDYQRDAPLFEAIRACPLLSQVKLIAEPWDIGPNGYQVGHFPAPFAEWNDRFRDTARRYWLHGAMSNGEFARRFAASSDLFQHEERQPHATVNLITAHDGFTLWDVVSFERKHNEANGEDNRDGHGDNYSHNHGKEGLNVSFDVIERRRRSVRGLLTTLLLSQGTPMLLAGDERSHTQHGNNNAYCQDNALSWLDWQADEKGLVGFTAALIQLRQRIPALTADRWWQEGDGNVQWLNAGGQPLQHDEWAQGTHRLQILLSGRWLITINATDSVNDIVLPDGEWRALPPFAGDDNPILLTVWHGPAHGVCVFQKQS